VVLVGVKFHETKRMEIGDIGKAHKLIPGMEIGMTKKGKLIQWLKQHPGVHFTRRLASDHQISQSYTARILAELPWAQKQLGGRNSRWRVCYEENEDA